MKKMVLFLFIATCSFLALADDFSTKLACKAAMGDMPNGSGASVFYPNGQILTPSAGKAGAAWYYQDGRILTTSMSVAGATFFYGNGRIFSTGTGTAGATWYYPDGKIITTSAPSLSPQEMAQLACDLILKGKN